MCGGNDFQNWAAGTEKADWLKELFLSGTMRVVVEANLVSLLLNVKKSAVVVEPNHGEF